MPPSAGTLEGDLEKQAVRETEGAASGRTTQAAEAQAGLAKEAESARPEVRRTADGYEAAGHEFKVINDRVIRCSIECGDVFERLINVYEDTIIQYPALKDRLKKIADALEKGERQEAARLGAEFEVDAQRLAEFEPPTGSLQTEHLLEEEPGIHEGKPVDIRQAEAAEGREFDTLQGENYPANQVPIVSPGRRHPRRLDSYDPVNGEIISRKSFAASDGQIAFANEFTVIEYFQEFALKYRNGATIATTRTSRRLVGLNGQPLAGQTLTGRYILEVPPQRYPISDTIKKEAAARNITIRDINGAAY
jgi:hypothetical protein